MVQIVVIVRLCHVVPVAQWRIFCNAIENYNHGYFGDAVDNKNLYQERAS